MHRESRDVRTGKTNWRWRGQGEESPQSGSYPEREVSRWDTSVSQRLQAIFGEAKVRTGWWVLVGRNPTVSPSDGSLEGLSFARKPAQFALPREGGPTGKISHNQTERKESGTVIVWLRLWINRPGVEDINNAQWWRVIYFPREIISSLDNWRVDDSI